MCLPSYILIVGQGRSGTNWLLQIFDQSERTFCRNEPNELGRSHFAELCSPLVPCREGLDRHARAWANAVRWASARMGDRDHRITRRKAFIHPWAHWLLLPYLAASPRARFALRHLMPQFDQPEWRLPHWLGSRSRLAAAIPVLKMNQVPGWAVWVLANVQDALVIHIVRHPGGFLHSWLARYVHGRDRSRILRANRTRLRDVASCDKFWRARFGDIDSLSLDATELWFWRYANELIMKHGSGRDNYELVVYEQLAADPLAHARALFERAGLPFSYTIARAVADLAVNSAYHALKWRHHIDPYQYSILTEVVADSPLRDLWLT
jgi:hypothetical protein